MKILLNGNNLDFNLEEEKNAGQILEALETLAEENHATIISISIDGKNVNAGEIEECYSLPIDSINEIAVVTVQEDDVTEALKHLVSPCENLAQQLEQVPVLLQTHKDGVVAEILKTFADTFDAMCHLSALICLFPARFESLKITSMTMQDFLKDFSPVLTDFENALKAGDTVLTGDLAEWELKPRLEQFAASLKEFN